MPTETPYPPTTPAVERSNRRRAGGGPGAGVRTPPAGTGGSTFRRYMPLAVGGVASPTVSGPKPPSSPTGTAGGWSSTPPPAAPPAITPKGGGVFMENGGVNPGTGGGGMPTGRPAVPSPGGSRYGGFTDSQLTQQNGQWGAQGRGGQFQAIGPNALARWMQQQPPPGSTGPMPEGPPNPTSEVPVSPPSGPIMAPGYVTAQQFADPIYDWFRNSQPQGQNDWNAFNTWFQQFGRQHDPTGWDRLYGSGGVPPGPAPPQPPSNMGSSNVGGSGNTYWFGT